MAELFRGEVGAVSLTSLLQLIEAEGFTGRLDLGVSGSISFVQGAAVAATCGPYEGKGALLELFVVDPTAFVFSNSSVAVAPSLGALVALIMAGCRLSDEWTRLRGRGVRAVTPALPADHPALAPLWPHFDGRRSLADCVRRANVARTSIIDALLAALEAGHIELGNPTMVVSGTADFDDALTRGREAIKEGRLDEATQWFEEALALRPDDRVAAQNLRRVEWRRTEDPSDKISGWFQKIPNR